MLNNCSSVSGFLQISSDAEKRKTADIREMKASSEAKQAQISKTAKTEIHKLVSIEFITLIFEIMSSLLPKDTNYLLNDFPRMNHYFHLLRILSCYIVSLSILCAPSADLDLFILQENRDRMRKMHLKTQK